MNLLRTIRPLGMLAVCTVVSCRGPKVPVGIEGGAGIRGGAGISVAAVLPDDPGQIQKLFRSYPPDSGVVPVYLSVTNGDTAAVALHATGDLPVGERLSSISLETGSGPIAPIHPREVLMRLAGAAEAPRHRKMGAWNVVGGMLIPPLGAYYAYRWGSYALDYRPLLRNSFFPAGRGGSFEPVVIEPGETASGFLYFPLDPPENPYYTEYGPGEDTGDEPVPLRRVRAESGFVLDVRPAAVPGTGSGIERVAPRFEAAGMQRIRIETVDCGSPPRDLFLLGRERGSGANLDLLIGSERDLARSGSLEGFVAVKRLNNKSGRLVDASACGRFAVCAVNFKQKARLFSIDLGGAEPALAADLRLDRSVLRVFALADGIYAITDDGFCGVYRYEDLGRTWYGRLGTSVSDALFWGGAILTFGAGEIEEFLCAGGRCGKTGRKGTASSGGIGDLARAGSSALAAHRGSGGLGDTLVVYDMEALREDARLALPGRIEAIDASGIAAAVQVEGGVVMRLEMREGAEPALTDAGWLPQRAQALLVGGDYGIMISGERAILSFDFEAIRPYPPLQGAGGAARARVRVGLPGEGGR
ncbi:MAG: hypothetical protein PHQ19_02635 [Candidatus Krumholzibacteria bacterium]|nr:hypothetical protein [Candidatus Krumholzibacteria bacterium]